MKANRELDELLVAYILKELSSEEEDLVIRFISSDEKNRLYFEELKNTCRLLGITEEAGEIDVNDEWKYFRHSILHEDKHLKIVKPKPETEPEIYFDTKDDSRWKTKKLLVPLAAAASVLIIFFAGWLFKSSDKQAGDRASELTQNKTQPVSTLLKRELNKSGKPRKLVLQDGSEIVLAAESELSYYDPFMADRRDIILKGKADFKVAKDNTRPFTVYSQDLATTALGTQFTVTAFEDALNTTVRLNEGKVVVKHRSNENDSISSTYYLVPGQELVFNNRKHTGRVLNFRTGRQPGKDAEAAIYKDSPELPVHKKGSWYMFNNQQLSEVFDQLSMLYGKKILYSKKDINNLYFIGSFNRADSLKTILAKITSLNNLNLVVKDDQFTISK
jgi:transmembrane sensor